MTQAVTDQIPAPIRPYLGAILGAFVPVASYWLSHREIDPTRPLWSQLTTAIALGGLVYSGPTVFAWVKSFVGHPVKAFGFVLLLEGVMICSQTAWLALTALCLLVAINAGALSLKRSPVARKRSKRNRKVAKPVSVKQRSGARLVAV